MTRTALILSLLALTSLACQKPTSEEATTPATEPAAASESEAPVEYEPAYPTDVSSEELSEDDVAQQKTHSHGDGEEHAHAEGGHEHGEEEDRDDHQH